MYDLCHFWDFCFMLCVVLSSSLSLSPSFFLFFILIFRFWIIRATHDRPRFRDVVTSSDIFRHRTIQSTSQPMEIRDSTPQNRELMKNQFNQENYFHTCTRTIYHTYTVVHIPCQPHTLENKSLVRTEQKATEQIETLSSYLPTFITSSQLSLNTYCYSASYRNISNTPTYPVKTH